MLWDIKGGVGAIAEIAVIARHRASSPVIGKEPNLNTDQEGSENSETVPFKMPNAPIKVKESSKRKYVSRILRAGTLRVSTRGR
jgi:hypothetical protein